MTTEIAKRPQFEMAALKAKDMFLQLAPEKTWNREIVFALQIIRGSEQLQKCAPESIRNAITNIATTGATLNPALHLAYLVQRDGKACLDFSYRGLAKLAVDSGSVLDVDAVVVHEKDEFYYEMGLDPKLVHRPHMGQDQGGMSHVYAIAILHNGIKKFLVLTKAEVDKVRKTSKGAGSSYSPWNNWYDEMARKTAVKKLYKLLPQSDRMSEAIQILNESEGLEIQKHDKAKEITERFKPEPKDDICGTCGYPVAGCICAEEEAHSAAQGQ